MARIVETQRTSTRYACEDCMDHVVSQVEKSAMQNLTVRVSEVRQNVKYSRMCSIGFLCENEASHKLSVGFEIDWTRYLRSHRKVAY